MPRRAALLTYLALAGALALALFAFARWNAGSAWAFPRFLLALLLLVYLPGKALVGRVRPRPAPLDDLALSLGLGVFVASACYWSAAALGRPRLALLSVPVAAAALLLRRERGFRVSSPGWVHCGLVGVVAAACAPLALLPVYYRNLARLPGGLLSYYPWPDAILHLSVVNALVRQVPPDLPFLPGERIRYHYGMDLLSATLAHGGGLDVADVTLRFVPTLLLALLVLAAFCFGRALLGSAPAGLLLAVLVVLCDDLSWLPGLFQPAPAPWSIHFFGMPTVMSLYGLNSMLPGLVLLFLALLALLGFSRERTRSWLLLAGALLAVTAAYKVFVFAQLMAALGLAAAVQALRFRDRGPAAAFALAAALAVPLSAALFVGDDPLDPLVIGERPRALVRIDPWPYVPAALVRSGLIDTWLGRQTVALLAHGEVSAQALLAFFGIAVPLYLAAAFGARAVGWGRLLDALRPRPGEAPRMAMAVFVLMGPVLALLFAITPDSYPPAEQYNEAAWFLVQSKFVAWVFAVEALLRLARGQAGRGAGLALGMLLLGLPSTLEFFARQASGTQLRVLGPQQTELLRFLRALPPGSVAWARSEIGEALIALTPCRASVFSVHPWYVLKAPDLAMQRARQAEFWSAWREGRLLRGPVDAFGASWIVADKGQDGAGPADEPALRTVYENDAYRVLSLAPSR